MHAPTEAGVEARTEAAAPPLERFRADLGSWTGAIVAAVASDTGEPEAAVRPAVEHVMRLLTTGPGWPDVRRELALVGDAACRAGLPRPRLLDRYLTTGWVIWDLAAGLDWMDRDALRRLGGQLIRGSDICASVLAEAYHAVDRELAARDGEARRSFLEELLGAPAADAAEAGRLRRLAARYGLDPDGSFRLAAISPRDRHAEDAAVTLADALARAIVPPTRTGRPPVRIRLPLILPWRSRAVVFAGAAWPGLGRLPSVLTEIAGDGWAATASPAVHGVVLLPDALAQLIAALRTAERIGHRGWFGSPDELALEELLLVDEALMRRTVEHELGPILADARMGTELVETLRVYFDSGENMRETARRLHLANRTVAYRLERIEALLGHPIGAESRQRLVVALIAHRILGASSG
jgi:hypothetical protein